MRQNLVNHPFIGQGLRYVSLMRDVKPMCGPIVISFCASRSVRGTSREFWGSVALYFFFFKWQKRWNMWFYRIWAVRCLIIFSAYRILPRSECIQIQGEQANEQTQTKAGTLWISSVPALVQWRHLASVHHLTFQERPRQRAVKEIDEMIWND